MSKATRRILVVAPRGPTTNTTVEQLARHGWGCQVVDLLTEAKEELKKCEYEIVLAAEHMADGRGYDLTDFITQRSSSLLVGVMLSDSYLWLPTVERGVRTLGMRAVNPGMLEEAMEDMLPHPALPAPLRAPPNLAGRAERHRHKQAVPPRRKSAAML
jgi:DNA-binding NtrC family response regulator